MTRTEKKYEKKIAKLVEQYRVATTTKQRTLICINANSIKSECAKDVLNGRVSDDFYKELFKLGEASMSYHFLEILAR